MVEKKDSLMKNTKAKRYKILVKEASERKWCFKNPSSSIKNENESIESVSINFLLEILDLNFFMNLFVMN